MRTVALAVTLFLSVIAGGCGDVGPEGSRARMTAAQAIFPQAATVRLYESDGRLNAEETGGMLLTPAQRTEFEAALRAKRPPPEDEQAVAACFIPHHFFRYYDAAGAQLGEVAVCFCCGGASVERGGPDFTFTADYERLGRLVKSLGLRTDAYCDE